MWIKCFMSVKNLVRPLLFSGLALAAGCRSVYSHKVKVEPSLDGRLTVMTYNLANARGNTIDFFKVHSEEVTKYYLDCIAEQIKKSGADIVGLNEVDFGSSRSNGIEEALYLAEKVGFPSVIEDRFFNVSGVMSLGNAILSKYPLHFNHRDKYGKLFGRFKHTFKTVLYADVDLLGRKLLFGVTHLNDSPDNKERLEEMRLIREYLEGKGSFVLVGDLNDVPDSAAMKYFLSSDFFSVSRNYGMPSYPADGPKYSIDQILGSKDITVGDLHSITAEDVGYAEPPSDHRNVFADVYWK